MKTAAEVIPREEVQGHKTTISKLYNEVQAITVTSQEELTTVATHVGAVKKAAKALKLSRDKYIQPGQMIIDQAKSDFNPLIEACAELERILKGKAQEFLMAEQKKKDELAAKEIKKVESGYQKADTAAAKISDIKEVETKVTGDNGTMSMKMVKEVVVTDEKLIPDQYYKPRELNMVLIRQTALAGIEIPGVEVKEKPQMDMRIK